MITKKDTRTYHAPKLNEEEWRESNANKMLHVADREIGGRDYDDAIEEIKDAYSEIFDAKRYDGRELPDKIKENYEDEIGSSVRRLIYELNEDKSYEGDREEVRENYINLADSILKDMKSRRFAGKRRLEGNIAAMVAGISGVLALFCLSPNINGNVISSSPIATNKMGLILAAVAIIAGFLFFRKRK